MPNILIQEQQEKLEWLQKQFTQKILVTTSHDGFFRKIVNKHNTIIREITKVLYFDSKLWYYYRIRSYDSTDKNKHFLIYFGHYQPSISNIISKNYIEMIEFENECELPPTMIAIEDAVDVVYNATINCKSIVNNEDNIIDIINENITSLNCDNNDDAETIIERHTYPMLNNYQYMRFISTYFGTREKSISKYIPINEKLINPEKTNQYHYDKKYYMHSYMPFKVFRSLEKLRNDNIINSKNDRNRIPYHIIDDNNNDSYKVMIIGHAIAIGKLYEQDDNNDKYFLERTSNNVIIGEDSYIDYHHKSIEVDNHYNYINSHIIRYNNDAVEKSFSNPQESDDCYNIDEKCIFNDYIDIDFTNDRLLDQQIIDDNNALKNKLRDPYCNKKYKNNKITLSDIVDIFSNSITKKFDMQEEKL